MHMMSPSLSVPQFNVESEIKDRIERVDHYRDWETGVIVTGKQYRDWETS